MFYTYVLIGDSKGSGGKFYVGSTADLKNRFKEHTSGEVETTKNWESIELAYYEACVNKTDARKRELQLKTGFGKGYLNRRLENYFKK